MSYSRRLSYTSDTDQGHVNGAGGLAFSRLGRSLVSAIMSKHYSWRNLCTVIAVVLLTGCKPSDNGSTANHARTKAGASAPYFQTPFQEESEFIVETIVSDLAEQVFYAKYRQLPDPKHFSVHAAEKPGSPLDTPVYELEISLESGRPDLHSELKIDGPIWSPEVYRGVTAALAREVALDTPQPNNAEDTALLMALTDGKAGTLEKKNRDLSETLSDNFSDPFLHEEAAVLVGAFTLREHSGDFYEIRSPLCRMTAHLAMAQLLTGGRSPSMNGRVAEAMLFTLMNDQVAALEKLGGIETNDETVAKWVRTLQADNTSDYRPLTESTNLTAIERIAWFRALARSVDVDIAWEKLAKEEKLTVDFPRIANEEYYSIENGHQLLEISLPLELGEIGTIYKLSREQMLKKGELVKALNEMPDRCFDAAGKVRVIGWGQWANFFQRQMCHAIQHDFNFLERKWGVPDEAKQFSTKCDATFGSLRLYPFVRRFNCTDSASYHSAVDDGFQVTVTMPQLTPAECWNNLCYRGPANELYTPNPNPHLTEWHKHNPPPGTAYNPLPRFDHRSLVERPDASARINTMHALAPYDRDISYNLIRIEYKQHPTYEQCQEVYKLVLPYATYAMTAVADTIQDQPDRYEELMSRAAELDPARYYNLGEYFQARQMDDKTAKYYEKGNELCSDSVNASYHASWLIKYYLKQGEMQKAQSVADAAGEVYSAAGLEAKAEFFEAMGKYAEAFEWYAKDEERYEDSSSLIGFCVRYKAKIGDTRFDAALKSRLVKLFPKGIEKVSLKDFQSAPADGLVFREENDLVTKAGMKTGDVVVAVNGTRTHNSDQYNYARDTGATNGMTLIVWQGNQYREIRASPPGNRFGVHLDDYTAN
ncbi:MAG: hypothetical protein ACLQAH_19150 [Limisphaerales bacterium]